MDPNGGSSALPIYKLMLFIVFQDCFNKQIVKIDGARGHFHGCTPCNAQPSQEIWTAPICYHAEVPSVPRREGDGYCRSWLGK